MAEPAKSCSQRPGVTKQGPGAVSHAALAAQNPLVQHPGEQGVSLNSNLRWRIVRVTINRIPVCLTEQRLLNQIVNLVIRREFFEFTQVPDA